MTQENRSSSSYSQNPTKQTQLERNKIFSRPCADSRVLDLDIAHGFFEKLEKPGVESETRRGAARKKRARKRRASVRR
jgi:hypothetical protein